jgi:non-ribosomal peptide synthetase component F
MHSWIYVNIFNKDDIVVQMARCSFDIHVQQVLGTLMSGATLVMLHPGGSIDFEYLTRVLGEKQITYMNTVPSLLYNLFIFVQKCDNRESIQYLRSLGSGGE